MCFSATASFVTAGALTTVGAVALTNTKIPSERWYAVMPILFGIQQFIEGVQWLVEKPSTICTTLGYGFIFFAFLIWPWFIPFAVSKLESQKHRKKLFQYLIGIGIFSSLYLLVWYFISPLSVSVTEQSIWYRLYVPFQSIGMPIYVLAVSSGLFSSRSRVRLFGFLMLVGFFVASLAYQLTFTSVWCFFAATASAIILWELKRPSHVYKKHRF